VVAGGIDGGGEDVGKMQRRIRLGERSNFGPFILRLFNEIIDFVRSPSARVLLRASGEELE
jgi:hypothetical protein